MTEVDGQEQCGHEWRNGWGEHKCSRLPLHKGFCQCNCDARHPSPETPVIPLNQHELRELSTYNAEEARGLVHTDEWSRRMGALQARFAATPEETPAAFLASIFRHQPQQIIEVPLPDATELAGALGEAAKRTARMSQAPGLRETLRRRKDSEFADPAVFFDKGHGGDEPVGLE